MDWFKIEVTEEKSTDMADVELEFDALFMAAGCPRDMALFASKRGGDRKELYFSPLASHYAAEIIRQYRGETCEAPRAGDVDLVEGFNNALKRLCAANSGSGRAPVQMSSG